MYKWIDTGKLLRRLADGGTVPAVPGNADYQAALAWVAEGNVIPGPDAPTPAEALEAQRLLDLDAQISGSATIALLKPMTNAQFDTWWAANVTNLAQANTVLKLLARVMLRRVL